VSPLPSGPIRLPAAVAPPQGRDQPLGRANGEDLAETLRDLIKVLSAEVSIKRDSRGHAVGWQRNVGH
jgi:hypothetical protein